MDISKAIKIIRKELVVKDEPWKAYKLLFHARDKWGIELTEEIKKTYGMVRHMYDPKEYVTAYDIPVNDCEMIEPIIYATNAQQRYLRYGWVLNHLINDKVKSYIDLGCYVGSMVTTAASKGIKSVGVDYTSQVIEVAKKRAKQVGVESLTEFFVSDVTKFNKRKADAVSSMEVIEHVVDPKQYINHICGLLNPGGWGYVSTPNGPFLNGKGNLEMTGGWEWDGKGVRGHVRVFTVKTMTELLKECNCEIAEISGKEDGLLHAKFRYARN